MTASRSGRTAIRVAALVPLFAALLAWPIGCARAPRGTQDDAGVSPTDQVRAPHYVDSWPAHGDTLSQAPELVQVGFDFDLATGTNVSVTKNGSSVTSGAATISDDNLVLRRSVSAAGAGTYVVDYTAVWPDGSSHEGRFSFTVDPAARERYADMSGKAAVTVRMRELGFQPALLVVSKGARVTWVNDESAGHYVNSDPHPGHNVLKNLNSKLLNKSAAYSYVFDRAGEWGYHCSAHFPGMTAKIVVVEPAVAAPPKNDSSGAGPMTKLPDPSTVDNIKAAHLLYSRPAHGSVHNRLPGEVVINFNFDLHPLSRIVVTKGLGAGPVVSGARSIASDRLSMRAPLRLRAGTSERDIYVVRYRAYWPDRSYHDGQFAFAVR